MHHHDHASGGDTVLSLCRNTISRIAKSLELLERKHGMTTAQFLARQADETLPDDPGLKEDWAAWRSSADSLKEWETLEKQYTCIRLPLRQRR